MEEDEVAEEERQLWICKFTKRRNSIKKIETNLEEREERRLSMRMRIKGRGGREGGGGERR